MRERGIALVGLVLVALIACPAPPPSGRFDPCLAGPVDEVRGRWPTAGAALDDDDVYRDATWFWAHKRGSLDGFGAVLATVTARPGPGSLIDLPSDIPAGYAADRPSLLFFDQQGDDPDDWPLIGMGYFYPFDPCERPDLQCATHSDFFVHEAGYHLVPIGDGGMRVATQDDMREGVTLDPEGCLPVEADALRTRIGSFRHGRNWVTHVWFPPEGEDAVPVWQNTDPWERWKDATDRGTIDGTLFYSQGDCACATEPVNTPRGCL